MTTANKITIGRLLLIPAFLVFFNRYCDSILAGAPAEEYRFAAIFIYTIASLSDALDGYVARHFNQKTRLGSIIDPIADKALMLAVVMSVTVAPWPYEYRLPFWFAGLVFHKEIASTCGALLIRRFGHEVRLDPHWIGKTATVLVAIGLGWPLLLTAPVAMHIIVIIGGVFTFTAGMIYTYEGVLILLTPTIAHERNRQETGHGGHRRAA